MAINENLNIKINADTSGFKKGLSSVKDGISGLMGSLGLIGGAVGLVMLGKKAIGLASDLTEVQNVVDTTFGAMSSKVDNFAKNALASFGLSELSAKKFSSTMGAMLKSSGLSGNGLLTMSTNLTALSGDMASFYNLKPEEAFDKLRAGIAGETEPLKQLGVNMSVANLEAFALSSGIKKSYDAMSEAEKMALRYNYIMSVTSDAQGDVSKTSGTWANQIRLLSENWNIFLGTLGGAFIGFLTPVLSGLNTLLSYLNTVFLAFKKLFAIMGGKTSSSGIASATDAQNGLNTATDKGTGITDANAKAAKKGTKALEDEKDAAKGVSSSFDKFNDITPNKKSSKDKSGADAGAGGVSFALDDPYKLDFGQQEPPDTSWVDTYIEKLNGLKNLNVVQDLLGIFAEISNITSKVWDNIKPDFEASFSNLFSGLGTLGNAIWNDGVIGLGGSLISSLRGWFEQNSSNIQSDLTTNFQNIFSGIFSIGNVFGNIGEIISSSIDSATPAIIDAFTSMVTAAYTVFDTSAFIITDAFAKIWKSIDDWVSSNKEKLKEALTGFWTESANTSNVFFKIITDVFNSLKGFWERWGQDILNIILKPLQTLGNMVLETWNKFVLPVWNKIVDWLKKIWDDSLKGMVDEVLGFVGRVAEVFNTIWGILGPILETAWANITNAFRVAFNLILDIIMPIIQWIIDLIKSIMKILNGVIDFIMGVFTGDWKRAWEGIKKVFEGIWDGVKNTFKMVFNIAIGVVEGFINTAIGLINSFMRNINLAIKAINSIPGVNIPLLGSIPDVRLPKLAKGGMAYGEVAAVVGDNFNARQDPEVISPLSKLKDIMVEALIQKEIIGGNGNGETRIVLTLENGETLVDMLINPMNNKAKNLGYSPVFKPA